MTSGHFEWLGMILVVLEMKCTRLPFADEGTEISARGARPAGDLLRDFLRVFEHRHCGYPFSGLRNLRSLGYAFCVSASAASAVQAKGSLERASRAPRPSAPSRHPNGSGRFRGSNAHRG